MSTLAILGLETSPLTFLACHSWRIDLLYFVLGRMRFDWPQGRTKSGRSGNGLEGIDSHVTEFNLNTSPPIFLRFKPSTWISLLPRIEHVFAAINLAAWTSSKVWLTICDWEILQPQRILNESSRRRKKFCIFFDGLFARPIPRRQGKIKVGNRCRSLWLSSGLRPKNTREGRICNSPWWWQGGFTDSDWKL